MDFIILLLCIGFGYLLWTIKKLEERLDAMTPQKKAASPKTIHEAPKSPVASHREPIKTVTPTNKPAWEFKMGAWVYTAIGGVALLLGLGFLLRFAIENNLISPTLRVALGLVLGGALVGLGYWLETRMRNFAHVLIGTGLGALYLSLYAATMVYSLIPAILGFILVSSVTLGGIFLALRFNTQSLAIFAMVGGYLTPFLLGTRETSPYAFFVYLIALNAVMLVIAWYKPWRILPGLSFVGTILSFYAWVVTNPGVPWFIPFIHLGILFALFFTRSIMRVLKGKLDPADYVLLWGNPIFFFSTMAAFHPETIAGKDWATGLAILFTLIHLGVAVWRERVAFIGIGSMFLAMAAPLYFEESRWFVLAWTYEALALGVLASQLKSRGLKIISHILFGLAAIGLIDLLGSAAGTMAWFNVRMLVFAIAIAGFIGMAWYEEQKYFNDAHKKRHILSSVHLLVSYLLVLSAITSEIAVFYQPHQDLWMSTAAVVLGALAIMIGLFIKSFELRSIGIATIGIAGLTAIVEAVTQTPDQIIFSQRVLALSICAAMVAGLRIYLRYQNKNVSPDEFSFLKISSWLASNVFLFFLVSAEVVNGVKILGGTEQSMQVALSVAWLIYAIILVIYGIIGKSKLSRGAAIALFALVIAKILLIDTAELDNFARFITFISLGGILLVAGFLYNTYKARIED